MLFPFLKGGNSTNSALLHYLPISVNILKYVSIYSNINKLTIFFNRNFIRNIKFFYERRYLKVYTATRLKSAVISHSFDNIWTGNTCLCLRNK